MNWKQARAKAASINCREAVAHTLKPTPHQVPQSNTPSVVLCKEKVRRDMPNDRCGNPCPKGRRL